MTTEQVAELIERLGTLIDEKEEEGDRLGVSNIRQANFTTGQAEGVRLAMSYLREYIR